MPRPPKPNPPKPNPKPTHWDHHYNYDWYYHPYYYYDWYGDDDNSYYYYLMRNSMAQKSNKTNPTPMPPTPPKMYDENGNSWELQTAYQQGFKDGFDAAMAYFMYNNMSISCPPAPEPTPTPPMAEGE